MRIVGPCYTCKSEMWIPDALYETANRAKGKITFYCAYGHGQVFCEGENEETKLRRERDRLQQRLAEKDDEIASARRQITATKGQMTKLQKRAKAGVCPCCNRTVSQMARHMATKHPTFVAEAAE